MKRREFLKWLSGAGAIFAAGATGLFSFLKARKNTGSAYPKEPARGHPQADSIEGFVGHKHQSNSNPAGFLRIGDDGRGAGQGLLARTGSSYGSMVGPPSGLDRFFLRAFENPLEPPHRKKNTQTRTNTPSHPEFHSLANPIDGMPVFQRRQRRKINVQVTERVINVANGVLFPAWTYNGMLPGPVIRATEGETLDIYFTNKTDKPHNLHFHGTHSILYDGWEPVPPGGKKHYRIEAGPVGIHPYHCHVPPLDVHMSRGLFGALIVDPPGGRKPAHEQVLILHGFDLRGRGQNDLYAWNGIAGFYDRYPIRVKRGELVRIYLLNMLEFEPVASFHLHAQTFDVYSSGTRSKPDAHTDIVTLGQTERAILEFRLPKRGRYMFHPHQIHIASQGTMGWIVAI